MQPPLLEVKVPDIESVTTSYEEWMGSFLHRSSEGGLRAWRTDKALDILTAGPRGCLLGR